MFTTHRAFSIAPGKVKWIAFGALLLNAAARGQPPAGPSEFVATKVGTRPMARSGFAIWPDRRPLAYLIVTRPSGDGATGLTRPVGDSLVPARRFTTDFSVAERPISENGDWHHLGASWAAVQSIANHAVGTQSGRGGYDDAYAYLGGFTPDQKAWATLWLDPAARGDYREVELLLRWSDSATAARGYECNLAWNGAYAEIVRWNGPYGGFTYVTRRTSFRPGIMPPKSGDVFTAAISGGAIRVYLDKNDGKGDQLIVTGDDETFKDGNPGMGFFIQGDLDPAQYGFSRYSASSE
jgi:hypothetical protein